MEDLEDHTLAKGGHVALLEGERGVGGEEIGRRRHEDPAIGAILLARCGVLVPHDVGPAGCVLFTTGIPHVLEGGVEVEGREREGVGGVNGPHKGGFLLVSGLVFEPPAKVLEHAPRAAKERVVVPARGMVEVRSTLRPR